MSDNDLTSISAGGAEETRLSSLRQEHRRLDAEIEAMQLQGENDLRLMSLKRRKLQLKDEIAWLMTKTRPDIIA